MNRKQNAITNRKYTKVVIKQLEYERLQSIRLDNRIKAIELAEIYRTTQGLTIECAKQIYNSSKLK